ncbi:MAG: 30S ribosomal protein S7 [bacterium ADurb.Bin429]|nr:MAG: 30S ribosomal protein S7 [bacterium ADurb.Bin429]
MPRKGPAPRRDVQPDAVFHSELISRFINKIMLNGKKSKAEAIFYGALELVHQRTGKDPLEVFEQAMRNVMPVIEVRPRRVGGATYQVPMEVRPVRKLDLGIRWIISNARKRGGKTMQERLAAEFMDAANSTGASVKKREDTHRMAEANKAFAHYRF